MAYLINLGCSESKKRLSKILESVYEFSGLCTRLTELGVYPIPNVIMFVYFNR